MGALVMVLLALQDTVDAAHAQSFTTTCTPLEGLIRDMLLVGEG